ncbi:interferon beta-like [Trichomycterus rosablanca]|uniref:interferon beta-like n=1 Tax=Trichomycterus rosablanca TaxID=2290929 RepID=UPI002F355430
MNALQGFTLLCTVIICMEHVWTRPMNCRLQRGLVENCQTLLESVGGRFPLQCLDDNVLVPFPEAAFEFNSSQQAVALEKSVYSTLTYIFSVFDEDEVPDQWKSLDDFQNVVFRQIEEYQCIMSKTQDSLDDFLMRDNALKEYFGKIQTILKDKDFQYCGWEFVRKEVLKTLQFILQKNLDGTVWSR